MNKICTILFLTIVIEFGHCIRETDENLDVWFENMKKKFEEDMDIWQDYTFDQKSYNGSGNPLLLSEYIERNDTETARRLSLVEPQDVFQNISSHAGFITVDKVHNSNLWFWYFPCERHNTKDSPLVIWLQGSPGFTSLFGLFTELGPYKIINNDTDFYLKKNPHSWHLENSLLFIDNPVGTGYSFTDNEDGYATNQITIGEHLYKFIIQFLKIFPETQNVPLYIVGKSYGAKYVSSFAHVIHKNNPTAELKVNLKGIAIGNGFIDPEFLLDYSSYFYNLGLVDDDQAAEMKYFEDKARIAIQKNDSIINNSYFHIHNAILTKFVQNSRFYQLYNYVYEENNPLKGLFTKFIENPEIRKALHVGNLEFSPHFKIYKKLLNDYWSNVNVWLEELLEHYKVLLFSGQMDMTIPYPMAVKSYRSLRWSKSEEYLNAKRRPWYEEDRVIGYTKSAGNLLEVFFRNAGYMIGMDQPKRFNVMINSFIRDIPLEN